LFAALLLAQVGAAAERSPNIIFIFADDWGYGDLSLHGSTFVETPNLDQMAAEGIDFTNFTVNNPVCSPSRTAVMTGQFPARHGVHQHFAGVDLNQERGMPDWLDPNVTMLPRLLQQAGYRTGHFGKWHIGRAKDAPTEDAYGYDEFATFNGSGINDIKASGLESVEHALDFIKRNKDEAFFVNLWLHETHLPHFPLDRYMEQFKYLGEQEQVYASVVAEADEGVGQILSLLRELGIDENTLVIFSSDNGPEATRDKEKHWYHNNNRKSGLGGYFSVGESGGLKGRKRSLYAGGIRVPFIVRWPGVVPAGRKDTTSVITAVDLLPTFLEFAGVALPEGYEPDGESVVAALTAGEFERTRPIFWEWKGPKVQPGTWPHLGVRDGRWKLITNEELGRTELYDLEADWAEAEDVSAENPDVVRELSAQLAAWQSTLPTEPKPSTISKHRKNARPAFSWDTVPLYAHFGDREGMTDEDVEFIASHYDFIVLEKAHGIDKYGDTEQGTIEDVARIKAVNPDARMLYYWNLLLDYPLYAASAQRADDPSWFIHHVDGGLDRKGSGPNALRRYDLSNPEWRKWWVSVAAEMLERGSMDGVFIDALPQVAVRPAPNIEKWGADKYEAIERGIGETLTALKQAIGPDTTVIYNGIRSVPGGWDHGGLKYLEFSDGAILEHFNVIDSQEPEQIAQDIERMTRAGKAGKVVILKAFPGFLWIDKEAMKMPLEKKLEFARQRITFPLAAYLIAAQEHSYFNYTWGYRADHGAYAWYPEYDRRLGPPQGDAVRDGYEYRREFEHASVYLDIEAKAARIEWR
jgi:N-acetylgalactosamine-6-sulfatase